MICFVEENSPAQRANVVESDVLIEINKKNIRREKFENVKEIVSNGLKSGKVELLLINMSGYKWFKNKNKRFSEIARFITPGNTDYFSSENKGYFYFKNFF